jgi:hypothetical protein
MELAEGVKARFNPYRPDIKGGLSLFGDERKQPSDRGRDPQSPPSRLARALEMRRR